MSPFDLHWPSATLQSTLLYEARAELDPAVVVGPTPEGTRAIFPVRGGRFTGPRMAGRFLASGADWGRFRPDGSLALDVRACLETDDGALIYVTYPGRIVVPANLQAAVFDFGATDRPAPDRYYFRVQPLFETAAPAYAWLNGICAVGVGQVVTGGVAYRVYAID